MNNRIREFRKLLRLSQEKLAELAGSEHKSDVSRLESGKFISAQWLVRVTEALRQAAVGTPHEARFQNLRYWELLIDQADIDRVISNDTELLLLEKYRKLSEAEQKAAAAMMDGLLAQKKG